MAILLGSANRAVIKRWSGLLSEKYPVDQATSMAELKNRYTEEQFDLILLHRPLVDTDAFASLRQFAPASRFFILSDRPTEDEGLAFLKLGIVGYGNTYISRERLSEAVRVISNGAVWLGQKVMQRLIMETHMAAEKQASPDSERILAVLTPREREIAELVARGQANLEIAADLDITERTVKAHLTAIYEKTHTGSRLNLALLINRQ